MLVRASLISALAALAIVACSSSDNGTSSPGAPDASTIITFDDGGDAIASGDGGYVDAPEPNDSGKMLIDGGYLLPDGGIIAADRFATSVVSFTPGDCAGFGITSMPGIVLGPPVGGGASSGSTDVVSLGYHGEIVLSVGPNMIVDGPGTDLLVFENPFLIGGTGAPYAELGEVSVSADGVTWATFPCDPNGAGPTYGTCAGWHPVYSAPGNGISPVDPATAGGDPFDLADVGLSAAQFVRIRDVSLMTCPANPADKTTSLGFDLDAIAVVNAQNP